MSLSESVRVLAEVGREAYALRCALLRAPWNVHLPMRRFLTASLALVEQAPPVLAALAEEDADVARCFGGESEVIAKRADGRVA